MKHTIKSRFDASVLHECEAESLKQAVENAVSDGVNLIGADLIGADLSRAYLSRAYLIGADLSRAYLGRANLSGADLNGADLIGANLSEAYLGRANLSGADLNGADLIGANLSEADLSGAYLSGANLSGANLSDFENDFHSVLMFAPAEIAGLREKLVAGQVDGLVYEGECACLLGTIANVRHCPYQELGNLKPDSSRPAEIWFTCIRIGDTPEKSNVTKLTVEWLDEFVMLASQFFKVQSTSAAP